MEIFSESFFNIGKKLFTMKEETYFSSSRNIVIGIIALVALNQIATQRDFGTLPEGIGFVTFLVWNGILVALAIVFLGLVFLFVGKPLGYWLMYIFEPKELEEVEDVHGRLITIVQEEDEKRGKHVYKNLAILPSSSIGLENTYLSIRQLVKLDDDNEISEVIDIKSKEIVWTNENNDVIKNRLSLRKDVPAKVHLVRFNSKGKNAETVGLNEFYTKISNGRYRLGLKFEGDNFSPRIFSIVFSHDGAKKFKIENISKVSKASFMDVVIGISFRIVAKSRLKKRWFRRTVNKN
jgi:hypothetical protein